MSEKLLERGGIQIEVSANREVEDALRYRPPEPPLADPTVGNTGTTAAARSARAHRGCSRDTSAAASAKPVNPANQLSQVADDVAAAVEFYRARFGEPPVNRIEVSPVPGRFGQGFAGMIYLSTLSYLPVTARPLSLMPAWQQVFYGELLRAHEAAHQWWGNIVTAGAYRHEWLMEALANYSALLFLESRQADRSSSTACSISTGAQLLAKGPDGETAESEGPVVQGRRLESSNNPNAWNAVAYGKGTWIIHMLRRRMGDAQFTKMLAELRRRYEWKTIDTEQFRLLCAEFLPPKSPDPKLENFFDQWVYGTGIPTLKLTYSVKGKPGAWKLTGTVTQSDVPDDFSVTVPVEIQTGRGKVVRQIRTGSEPVHILGSGHGRQRQSGARSRAQACCDVRIVVSPCNRIWFVSTPRAVRVRHHRSPLQLPEVRRSARSAIRLRASRCGARSSGPGASAGCPTRRSIRAASGAIARCFRSSTTTAIS